DSAWCFSWWRLSNSNREMPEPYSYERSCSSHAPPLSQTGQSNGWLMSVYSTIEFWARLTGSERVSMTMPSITWVVQVAMRLGNQKILGSPVSSSRTHWPSLSLRGAPMRARHMRQAPMGDMYSWLQKYGTSSPALNTASMRSE